MKRIYVLPILLVGVFAASMLMSTSAMAATEECIEVKGVGLFMKSGARLPDLCEEELLASDGNFELFTFLLAGLLNGGNTELGEKELATTGELLLEDTKVPLLGKAKVLCSWILDFLSLPATEPSHLEVLKVLNLAGTEIGTPLVGTALECENQENCGTPLIWYVGLPWLIELELLLQDNTEIFVGLLTKTGGGTLGWEVECMSLGLTDECTLTESVFGQKNVAGGVEVEFSEALTELAGLSLANCSQGGTAIGIVSGTGTTTLVGGGALTISSLE
jgi:hypothetical protein